MIKAISSPNSHICSNLCVEKVSVAIPADLWYVFVLQGGEAYARNTDSPVRQLLPATGDG